MSTLKRISTALAISATIAAAIVATGCAGTTGTVMDGGRYGATHAGPGKTRPRPHEGVDWRIARGHAVIAPADGVVMKAVAKISPAQRARHFHCHHEIELTHEGRAKGYKTRYCHLGKLFVKFGEKVKAGQKIATVGQCGKGPPQCGDHLHFEVVHDWVRHDPLTKTGGCFSKGKAAISEERPLYHPLEC